MILVLAVVLGILIALLRGGSLLRLAQVPFKHGWLAFVAIGLQVAAVYAQQIEGLAAGMFIGSYLLLIGLIVLNRRLAGVPIIGLGLALNALVTAVNGGYMPVTPEAVERAGLGHLVSEVEAGTRILGSKDMVLSRADSYLWFLGDVFVLKVPWPTVFSIGDVLLAVGVVVFFQYAMLAATPSKAADSGASHIAA
jgi:hypothetical protein